MNQRFLFTFINSLFFSCFARTIQSMRISADANVSSLGPAWGWHSVFFRRYVRRLFQGVWFLIWVGWGGVVVVKYLQRDVFLCFEISKPWWMSVRIIFWFSLRRTFWFFPRDEHFDWFSPHYFLRRLWLTQIYKHFHTTNNTEPTTALLSSERRAILNFWMVLWMCCSPPWMNPQIEEIWGWRQGPNRNLQAPELFHVWSNWILENILQKNLYFLHVRLVRLSPKGLNPRHGVPLTKNNWQRLSFI